MNPNYQGCDNCLSLGLKMKMKNSDAMKQYTKESISTDEIRRTFHCLDHDNHGCIEYSQFIAALIQSKIGLKDGLVFFILPIPNG